MGEVIDRLLHKGYDWVFIHSFLSIRDIGDIWFPNPRFDIDSQIKHRKSEQKINIDKALIEIDFLRPN